jgi:MFS family permease
MADVLIPLRRNLRFQTFWTASASSTLGQAVGDVAYPLAIVTMTGSPGKAALFSALLVAGMLVAGLPAGSLADRYDTQRLALAACAVRTVVAVVVAVALAGDWLTLPLLLASAIILGAGQALAGAANMLLLRSIVPGEQLTSALTQDEVRINGASLAGPSLAGVLYGVGHVAPFAFTAGAFFVALVATALLPVLPVGQLRIRAHSGRPKGAFGRLGNGAAGDAERRARVGDAGDGEAGAGGDAERGARVGDASGGVAGDGGMLAGLRELWGQPVLRATVLLIMGVNTVGAGLELVVIVILRHQAVPAYAIGLALGIGAAGGLAGAPLVGLLHRLPPGVLLLVVCGIEVPVMALLAVPLGPWWAAGVLFVGLLGVPALRVLADILVIRQAPPERRGRVVTAFMTLIALGMPAGIAGCGLLLQYLPAQTAMLTLAAAMAAVTGYGLSRPELRRAVWPTDERRTGLPQEAGQRAG